MTAVVPWDNGQQNLLLPGNKKEKISARGANRGFPNKNFSVCHMHNFLHVL
jgi:hypothetical protein